MRQVRLDLGPRLDELFKSGRDLGAGSRIGQVRAIAEADAKGSLVTAGRAVVVGKGKAPGGHAVPAGHGKPAGLGLGEVKMDLGALGYVAGFEGFLAEGERGGEGDVGETVAGCVSCRDSTRKGLDLQWDRRDEISSLDLKSVLGRQENRLVSLDDPRDFGIEQQVASIIGQNRPRKRRHATFPQLVPTSKLKHARHAVIPQRVPPQHLGEPAPAPGNRTKRANQGIKQVLFVLRKVQLVQTVLGREVVVPRPEGWLAMGFVGERHEVPAGEAVDGEEGIGDALDRGVENIAVEFSAGRSSGRPIVLFGVGGAG